MIMTSLDVKVGDRITILPPKARSAHTRAELATRFTIDVTSIRPDLHDAVEVTGIELTSRGAWRAGVPTRTVILVAGSYLPGIRVGDTVGYPNTGETPIVTAIHEHHDGTAVADLLFPSGSTGCGYRLTDLDLSAGRLVIRRATARHVVYLDERTHALIAAWLRHRCERWPKSNNPHLLVSRHTAMDTRQQSIGLTALRAMLEPLGVTPSALRADRILDEARQTADPIHLMRLFGICDSTALKYVFAAHSERQTELIR